MRPVLAILIASLVCGSAACAREPTPMNHDAFSNPELAPLADAVRRGDAPEIRRQLERVPADTPGSDGDTLLMEAIRQGKKSSVEALLEGGADPNRANCARKKHRCMQRRSRAIQTCCARCSRTVAMPTCAIRTPARTR